MFIHDDNKDEDIPWTLMMPFTCIIKNYFLRIMIDIKVLVSYNDFVADNMPDSIDNSFASPSSLYKYMYFKSCDDAMHDAKPAIYDDFSSLDIHKKCMFFSLQDIFNAINSTKSSSSPGLDMIPYTLFKCAPYAAAKLFFISFNSSNIHQYIPPILKVGGVLNFPKPKRDDNFVTNYRPITLLPSVYKIYE